MQQTSLNLKLSGKKTRKRLQKMEQVVPWVALVERIVPYYLEGRNGPPPFLLEAMLRVHFMLQWFSFSVRPWMKPSLTHRCLGLTRFHGHLHQE